MRGLGGRDKTSFRQNSGPKQDSVQSDMSPYEEEIPARLQNAVTQGRRVCLSSSSLGSISFLDEHEEHCKHILFECIFPVSWHKVVFHKRFMGGNACSLAVASYENFYRRRRVVNRKNWTDANRTTPLKLYPTSYSLYTIDCDNRHSQHVLFIF